MKPGPDAAERSQQRHRADAFVARVWGNRLFGLRRRHLTARALFDGVLDAISGCFAAFLAARARASFDIAFDGTSQVLLNCADKIGGTCSGGYPAGVWVYMMERGGVEYESCQQYQADDSGVCERISRCRQCTIGESDDDVILKDDDDAVTSYSTCWGVPSTPSYGPYDDFSGSIYSTGVPRATIGSYGHVAGETSMKAEILLRGPIVCLVEGEPLRGYRGGIFKGQSSDQVYTHALVVTGWGKSDEGDKYVITTRHHSSPPVTTRSRSSAGARAMAPRA